MPPSNKLKSVDFFRRIPKDLTEASVSGAGLSIVAAVLMFFLFAMELNDFMSVSTSTTVIVDNSEDSDLLRIDFNVSFPALSCEFASVDISDVLGTNRLNLTKTVRKFPIDSNLKLTGPQFVSEPLTEDVKHDEEIDEEHAEGAIPLNARNFERASHEFDLLVVNFYAPWCSWSNKLKPAWEKAATIMRERYDPEMDGRILLAKVNCTQETELCKRNHVQGYPSIRIYRKGRNDGGENDQDEHESYYGHRDTDSLVKAMEDLVASLTGGPGLPALDGNVAEVKRPAPKTGGCRVEGFVLVKKVPGNLIVSARSAAHSFDASQMNMSHVVKRFSFGRSWSHRERDDIRRMRTYIPRMSGKLDGRSYIANPSESNANVTIEHYIQAVKTELRTKNYKLLEQHVYTAHHSLINTVDIPVAKFHYELSPMQVLIEENKKSFTHFITYICAIIGGVYTVAGILDSVLHNGVSLVKKIELGKNF